MPLSQLQGQGCKSVESVEFETSTRDGFYAFGLEIRFADGTKISAQFWRLIASGKPIISIFDHRQKYGLPQPIDAFEMLRTQLIGKGVSHAAISKTSGDLLLSFEGDVELELFNFTAYEVWEIKFPDGTSELSNYALGD